VATVVESFEPLANPEAAAKMAAYMRDQFPFLGISAVARDNVLKPMYKTWKPSSEDELRTVSLQLWALPEREYQYAAGRLLRRYAGQVGPDILTTLAECAQTKSWWDTVDELVHGVGDVASIHPETIPLIESWIEHEDFWMARMAILHQLGHREPDLNRLARLCLARAHDNEFFVRKAIGWALREASCRNPKWVATFIETHRDVLSPLSRREGMKAIVRAGSRGERVTRTPQVR
jgi:3-methyladenine DNA glycosylase AlkD